MKPIERRVSALEDACAENSKPLVIWVDAERTEDQRRTIEEAERIGRPVVTVTWLDNEL